LSVGYSATKADIDSRSGGLALSLRNTTDEIRNFKIFLDSKPDGDLTALGYTAGDINTLRSAFVDLARLVSVYEGTQAQPSAYDFRTFAKLLTGTA